MRRNLNGTVLAIVLAATSIAPALAWRGNNLMVNDGMGDQVTVRHGFFGRNTSVVKDRLGDGYATQTGLFGTRTNQVNVLGNGFYTHRGIFGGSTTTGHDLLGDSIQTRRGIFGRRTTYVNASGAANTLSSLWQANKSKILGNGMPGPGALFGNRPSAPPVPNMMPPNSGAPVGN